KGTARRAALAGFALAGFSGESPNMCPAVKLQRTMDIRMIPAVRAVEPAWADKVRSLVICFSSVSPARNAPVRHSEDRTSMFSSRKEDSEIQPSRPDLLILARFVNGRRVHGVVQLLAEPSWRDLCALVGHPGPC